MGAVSGRDDDARRTDEAWREIVDNYGDRPDVSDVADVGSPAPPSREEEPPPVEVEPRRTPAPPTPSVDPFERLRREEERFVPPPPPPVPSPGWRRGTAWAGLFVAPAVVLVLLVAQVDLPTLLDYALVAWFVGGFGYLVATMRDEPRDPGDDGSRV